MEATSLSKLKVLLVKYNSIMDIYIVIITLQGRIFNLEHRQKSKQKEVGPRSM